MPNNAIPPHRQMADFCSSGENPSPACAFFVRAGARAQAQRQLRKGSALRRSLAARQHALHKERVIYHIHNTCTINSNSNINCLICLICFKGASRVLRFASPCQKSCAHCLAEARAQAQRQLRRALPGAHDRRQPMSISNLIIIIFIITLIFIIILIIS